LAEIKSTGIKLKEDTVLKRDFRDYSIEMKCGKCKLINKLTAEKIFAVI